MKKFIEIFGWYGTVAILGAYALNSFGLLRADSASYQLLNITGAVGVMLVSYAKKVYQSVTINLVWAIIGAVALFNLLLRH